MKTKTVYVCERRTFDTLEAARGLANKYFQRRGIIVAITARQKRIRK